ncbi:MAG: HU family DNA-binding protein [Dysgonamonadaceae bacterium]|jgi:DNA-binding protein HU-beta|nr:HU family DNA-binding protein [Dysgonamonadaceae bacterium]MDD3356292.1 HU family DNA-binding protein [Dysgonamonadaceae bacterium]MDD3727845.1 HU family DNA-binding protein [Dysgonamonadaceae bacterium]MDD4246728.1 HU family DNA-binding protein [Dysgonamonadaceae bacterium]MDD4605457.1 HU family DNA-binding protein [Dysgonamonadaceae bacterium]
MNKSELVSAVAQKSGLSKVDAKKALDGVLQSISEELKNDGRVVLVGFGTFSVTERSARKGINPRTKEPIDIPAKKVVKFKAGSELSAL